MEVLPTLEFVVLHPRKTERRSNHTVKPAIDSPVNPEFGRNKSVTCTMQGGGGQ